MRFLIDRCAGSFIAQWLRAQGHDVAESRERGPDPGDHILLAWAARKAASVFLPLMRVNVYVDGFNLYYGAVKGTPYRCRRVRGEYEWALATPIRLKRPLRASC